MRSLWQTSLWRSWIIVFVFGFLSNVSTCLKLYAAPAALPASIPASCRAVMAAEIACGPRFIKPSDIMNDVPFNTTFLGEYCNSTCTTSFTSYINNINTRCGNTIYDFGPNAKRSANDQVAPVKWARDTACLTGSTATDFCLPKIHGRTVGFCADCTLKYFTGMLSSVLGTIRMNELAFTSLLSSCGVSPTKYPHSTVSGRPNPPAMTSSPNITCWGGKQIKVKKGDTCDSIAAANRMAIDRFLYLNGIDYKCNSLSVGSDVCIRDGCKLHTIKPNESCKNITSTYSFSRTELVQWNPILETGCDNTTIIVGRSICVTPPGTNEYTFTPTATWNNVWTWPDGSWVAGPTQGTPMGNTSEVQWTIPTSSMSISSTANPTLADYYKFCPLTEKHYEDGFDWKLLEGVCLNLLTRYCDPILTGTPLPSTSFPSSCFPPYPDPTSE